MELIALLVVFWAWLGPILAIGATGHPVWAVIIALASIWAFKTRGGGACLILLVWGIWGLIALFSVGGMLALTTLICWGLVFLALGNSN